MKMSIGAFLIERLASLGLSRIYGVPGDYNLEFCELLENSDKLSFVGTCNELNGSYAADGEARIQGFAAVLTTYGVGDLSALPGIAGAYSERVPVLSISGAPPLHAIRSRALLHHTLADGNYDNVMNCYREFTVAQASITPENAVSEIDRVLQACLRERHPAYLQLPSDICSVEIDVPDHAFQLEAYPVDAKKLGDAATCIATRLKQAERPMLLIDSMVRSQRLAGYVQRLVDRFGLDFATLMSAKSILSETDPHFIGIYNGKSSKPDLFERVASADCMISLGVRFVDATSGWFSQSLDSDAVIDVQAFDVTIGDEYFAGVPAAALLDAIAEQAPEERLALRERPVAEGANANRAYEKAWGQASFWQRIEQFLAAGDVVIAENGTSQTGLGGLNFPEDCDFVSQAVWGAIGYTLPSLLGISLAAPDRRHLLFIGDGSFQLTGQELSTILRHDLKPVIFLINNGGYTIERTILGETSAYNDVAGWRYAELPSVLGPNVPVRTFVVTDMSDLEAALEAAATPEALTFIEVKFEPMDCPKGLIAAGKMARYYDYGNWVAEK